MREAISIPALGNDATYYEPFLGGGSFFFALQPDRAVLSDINPHLIATYRALKSSPAAVISGIKSLTNDPETYERIRSSNPTRQVDQAVRLIYLTRTSFGGIYRENAAGKFNVPYGKYTDRTLCQETILRSASKALQGITIQAATFTSALEPATAGDLVYLDPPYITGHTNNGFARYNRKLFTWDQQIQLAALARDLKQRGVHVIVSNSAHPDVVGLYEGFYLNELSRHSAVSRDAKGRGMVSEALLTTYPGAINGSTTS